MAKARVRIAIGIILESDEYISSENKEKVKEFTNSIEKQVEAFAKEMGWNIGLLKVRRRAEP
jgi:hypothetical protein